MLTQYGVISEYYINVFYIEYKPSMRLYLNIASIFLHFQKRKQMACEVELHKWYTPDS